MADSWRKLSLRDANVLLIDCDHRTPAAVESGYPYVAIPQLKDGHIDLASARRISEADFIQWTRKARPIENDVVLSRRTNPGVTAFVPRGADFALGQNLVLLRADGNQVYPPFLRWLVRGAEWWKQIGKFLNVGAVFDSLRCADVPKFELSIPPIPEQRAIDRILGTLDDKIELNRRMNETLEGIARALFKSWFVDFDPVRAKVKGLASHIAPDVLSLFPNAFDASGYPEGWRSGMLLDLCELKRGYDLPTPERSYGAIPIISSSGISGYHAVPMAQAPGVVTGRYGTIGEVYFINSAYWPLNTALYVRDFKSNSPRFVYYVLRAVSFLNYSDKAAVPGINRNHIHQAPVILPPRSIQEAFERLLSPLWKRQEVNDTEAAALATLRDTLLPKLISGELRVKDAEKRVEALV